MAFENSILRLFNSLVNEVHESNEFRKIEKLYVRIKKMNDECVYPWEMWKILKDGGTNSL
mgnify:CR=1 FL=1